MKKVLIVEDDADIAEIEKDYLEINGYEAFIAETGNDGLREALTGKYDLVLLDIMLPGTDGFEICKKIREELDIPIMILSARKTDIDKIRGLGLGADDYIEKPFSPGVLMAKIKSQLAQYDRLKYSSGGKNANIIVGNITLETDTHRVFVGKEEKLLPNKEFQLLKFFMTHINQVFSRDILYSRIWGEDSLGNVATVSVHVNRLREAIEENPGDPKYLVTVWGVGYKFQSGSEMTVKSL